MTNSTTTAVVLVSKRSAAGHTFAFASIITLIQATLGKAMTAYYSGLATKKKRVEEQLTTHKYCYILYTTPRAQRPPYPKKSESNS